MGTIGRLLYDNVLSRAVDYTYSVAPIVGYEPINAWDWHDWSLFATELSGVSTLDFELPAGTEWDSWAIYAVPFDLTNYPDEALIGLSLIGSAIIGQTSGTCVIDLQKETSPGSGIYTTIDTVFFQSTRALYYKPDMQNTHNGEKLRLRFTNGSASQLYIREICVGKTLLMPLGQHAGIAPPSLVSGLVITNTMSTNGSYLGRQTRRTVKRAEIMMEPVSVEWVRTNWNPLALHMAKYAAFWIWDYYDFPDDLAFVVATDIPPPENIRPGGKMKFNMPLAVIT